MWLGSHIAVAMVKAGTAVAPIRPQAWEPPHATGAALKRQRQKQTNKKTKLQVWRMFSPSLYIHLKNNFALYLLASTF